MHFMNTSTPRPNVQFSVHPETQGRQAFILDFGDIGDKLHLFFERDQLLALLDYMEIVREHMDALAFDATENQDTSSLDLRDLGE